MEETESPLKIGRIPRSVERALGLSLPNDVSVFIGKKMLSSLIEKEPDRYLSRIEEIGDILKFADFVSFSEKESEFVFERRYFKDGYYKSLHIYVGYGELPGKWYVNKIKSGPREMLPDYLTGRKFVRPEIRKKAVNG